MVEEGKRDRRPRGSRISGQTSVARLRSPSGAGVGFPPGLPKRPECGRSEKRPRRSNTGTETRSGYFKRRELKRLLALKVRLPQRRLHPPLSNRPDAGPKMICTAWTLTYRQHHMDLGLERRRRDSASGNKETSFYQVFRSTARRYLRPERVAEREATHSESRGARNLNVRNAHFRWPLTITSSRFATPSLIQSGT